MKEKMQTMTNTQKFVALCLLGTLLMGMSFLVGKSIVQQRPNIWMMIILTILGLWIFWKYKIGFYIIMVSVFVLDWLWFLYDLVPQQLTWTTEFVLIFLLLRVIILRLQDHKFFRTPIDVPISIFLLFGVISAVINLTHPITMLLGFRFDLKFILMFYIMINLRLEETFLKKAAKSILIFLMLQVLQSYISYLSFGPGDWAMGTTGGSAQPVLAIIGASLFIGLYLYFRPNILYVIVGFLFCMLPILNLKMGFLYFLPVTAVFLSRHLIKKYRKKLLFIAPLVLLATLWGIKSISKAGPSLEDPRYLLDFMLYYESGYVSRSNAPGGIVPGRLRSIEIAHNAIRGDPLTFLLGYGPGVASPTFVKQFEGKFVRQNNANAIFAYNQIAKALWEYGYVGLFLYSLALLMLFKMNMNFFVNSTSGFWKAISFGFEGTICVYFLGFLYYPIWRDVDAVPFILWFLAATIYIIRKNRGTFK